MSLEANSKLNPEIVATNAQLGNNCDLLKSKPAKPSQEDVAPYASPGADCDKTHEGSEDQIRGKSRPWRRQASTTTLIANPKSRCRPWMSLGGWPQKQGQGLHNRLLRHLDRDCQVTTLSSSANLVVTRPHLQTTIYRLIRFICMASLIYNLRSYTPILPRSKILHFYSTHLFPSKNSTNIIYITSPQSFLPSSTLIYCVTFHLTPPHYTYSSSNLCIKVQKGDRRDQAYNRRLKGDFRIFYLFSLFVIMCN